MYCSILGKKKAQKTFSFTYLNMTRDKLNWACTFSCYLPISLREGNSSAMLSGNVLLKRNFPFIMQTAFEHHLVHREKWKRRYFLVIFKCVLLIDHVREVVMQGVCRQK